MYEFLGITVGLLLLAVASELGGTDHVVKRDFAPKPLVVVALR